ncbi:F-box protein SKIP14 [Acorus calamus]|uniref:F-box protein SKIP14 n=1 Tax=Acorus calamus TaxID=4465 RepID=A0AAV9CIX6_ACOCL|nr:F-box protein SKIP14 [Acorus calamus]
MSIQPFLSTAEMPPPPAPPTLTRRPIDDSPPPRPEPSEPHGALHLVLAYLPLPDLIAFHRVCTQFRDAVAGDPLLWRDVSVEPPLSGRLTDEALLEITSRADGRLRSLALVGCPRVSDAGILRVARLNRGISKGQCDDEQLLWMALVGQIGWVAGPEMQGMGVTGRKDIDFYDLCVPGCTYLTANGIVRVVKELTERNNNLKHLKVHGISNMTKGHLEVLKSRITPNLPQEHDQSTPFTYAYWRSLPSNSDGIHPIDIDICPKCRNTGLVFECTRESCQSMRGRWTECKACYFCIARCEDCGGCIDFDEPGEETACSHLLCLDCWLRLPKCNLCNRPYCERHEHFHGSDGFICEQCLFG